MLANLNLPILIAVVIAGTIGFVALMVSGGKVKHDNQLDDIDEYNQERARRDAVGVGDGSYYRKSDD